MDFDWNCLLGKFQPSQIVCTQCSKRYEIRCSRKTCSANETQQVYRVMQSERNLVRVTSGYKTGRTWTRDISPSRYHSFFSVLFFVTFFLIKNLEVACFVRRATSYDGEASRPFFENHKKCPDFGKFPDCIYLCVKFFHSKCSFKSIQEKKIPNFFPAGPSFHVFLKKCLSKYPNSTKPPLVALLFTGDYST